MELSTSQHSGVRTDQWRSRGYGLDVPNHRARIWHSYPVHGGDGIDVSVRVAPGMVYSDSFNHNRAPTSGGQYHWVSEFAPRSAQKFLSFVTGMSSTRGSHRSTCTRWMSTHC